MAENDRKVACMLFDLLLTGLSFLTQTQANGGGVPENTPAMSTHFGRGTPALYGMKDLQGHDFNVPPLKGHWTLLYFWADWCVPCIQHGIPELTEFSRSLSKQQREQIKIIAIRFNSPSEAGDWADFKKTTERLEKTVWHAAPPFPLVYDATTKVTTEWGIHALPTYALIDPLGNLVRDGDLEVLRKELEQPVIK